MRTACPSCSRRSLTVVLCRGALVAACLVLDQAPSLGDPLRREDCPAASIATDTTIAAGDTQYDGTALTIDAATVTIAGHHTLCRLALVGGAALTHAAADTQGIDLDVLGSLVIDAGSRIDADGKGWPHRTGPGQPAVGSVGGAGHGGRGGIAVNGTAGGACYGSVNAPREPGSGGGGATGGTGGGVIHLAVTDTLVVAGRLSADGSAPANINHSGGSGGSIWVTAGAITGSGTISADGGNAAAPGGGGGGRIAIAAATLDFAGTTTAFGGSGGQRGGAGSVLLLQGSHGELRLDNGGLPAGARSELTDTQQLAAGVLVTGGAVLEGPPRLVVAGDLEITATGSIAADGSGFTHGTGPGAGSSSGGGGHGGRGGGGASGFGGGTTYGSTFFPATAGSGGSGATGGAGGGLVRLTIQGQARIDGHLGSDGTAPAITSHGAGAGGAIRLTTASLTGSGTITAAGGSSGTGGGGGGGRVAIYAGDCLDEFDVLTQVAAPGGAGIDAGEPGSVFYGYDHIAETGEEDAYLLPPEPTTPSVALVDALAGLDLVPLDLDPAGGAVATSLAPLPTDLADARLVVRLRAGASAGTETDRLVLGFADASGLDEAWSRYLGSTSGTTDPGLIAAPWIAGRDTTLVLDLDALPLVGGGTLDLTAAAAARQGVDFVVRHNTAVDFVMLTYCTSGPGIVAVDEAGERPGEPVIAMTCRPNPFNPRTIIHFDLREPTDGTLTVYDLRGRRVADLLRAHLAAGSHAVTFAADRLPAGAYLARLQTGRGAATTKLMLVR